jgi:hypothetical protein
MRASASGVTVPQPPERCNTISRAGPVIALRASLTLISAQRIAASGEIAIKGELLRRSSPQLFALQIFLQAGISLTFLRFLWLLVGESGPGRMCTEAPAFFAGIYILLVHISRDSREHEPESSLSVKLPSA